MDKDGCAGISILFVIVVAIMGVGSCVGTKYARREAVEKGHAKWVTDSDGYVSFEWLPPVDKEAAVEP